MATAVQHPPGQPISPGKMSWRKFKQMLLEKQRQQEREKAEEQPQRGSYKPPEPQQNKSQNNNQAVIRKDPSPTRKKPTMKEAVQMQINQSKAFGKAKLGDTQTSQSPKRKTSPPKKPKRDRSKSPEKRNTSREPKSQKGNPANTTQSSKSPRKADEADQDIPIIWYTKPPPKQSPGKSSTNGPAKQGGKDPRQKQPTTGTNEKANKKSGNKLVKNQNSNTGEKNAQALQGQHKSSNEMARDGQKGATTRKGKSTKPKGKTLEDKRKKYIKRISKQKPKQSDWKNAESRTTQKPDDRYVDEPVQPVVVDRHDLHEHGQRVSRRDAHPKRDRNTSPHKSPPPNRSRSESPQKRPTERMDRRSRSQSPEKRYASPSRKHHETKLVERTIPKIVRVIGENGEQQIIVEKKEEKIELFKGRYPNYLRTGEPPNLKKRRKMRPPLISSAPVSAASTVTVLSRPRPAAWFDRSAYHNDKYEAKLHKRKLIRMGMAVDDEFEENHGDTSVTPTARVHKPRTGAFYSQTPDIIPVYNRGRVSALSYDEHTPRQSHRPVFYSQENLLPADEGVEVRYDDGYEVYRNRYPNYLRQKQWKKSVPLRIQYAHEPESDDEYPQYHQHQDPRYPESPSPPLPPLQHDEESESEVDGFRHRRELGSTSPKRDMLLNMKTPRSDPHDSGVGSNDKTPEMTPPPRSQRKANSPPYQYSRQHTDIEVEDGEPEETPGDIPEVLQSLLSAQNGAFITETGVGQTSRLLSVQSDQSRKFGRSTSELDHATWPRYSISINEGVAAVVRCPRSHVEEAKRALRFEDSIPASIHHRLPTLPHMEFEDFDGSVRMSPMKLHWDNSQAKGRPMQHAIYLALPIKGSHYNEILQQLLFLYTNDLKKWQQLEGRLITLIIEGEKHDFIEVYIDKPFRFLIFDVKVRYREDTKTISPNGGELESQMEHGIRVEVKSRTFDRPAKMKLKVEPLDMNETDIRQLVPSIHAVHAVAVSPIVKLATSEPMKQAVSIFVPKPGHSVFGSVRMGVHNKMGDLKNLRVHLLTKEKEVARFNASATVKRELAKELEFQVRIWKYGGRCYCVLVLEGVETVGPGSSEYGLSTPPPSDSATGFLSDVLMKQMALEMTYDDVQLRQLGQHLLNSTTANTIIDQHPDNIEMAMFKILRRWKNQNKRTSESILIRRLVTTMKEIGLKEESSIVRQKYDAHLTGSERNTILSIFDELKACPSVLVNWKLLAKYLGLSPEDMSAKDLKVESPSDIRRTCSRMLKKVFEKLEGNTEYYRDILMVYVQALENIGCHKIAASIEKRHMNKFYVNPIA